MTPSAGYDFCTIFLDGADRQAATDLIAATLSAEPATGRHALRVGSVTVDVLHNGWAGTSQSFVGWPIKIDIAAEQPGPAIVEHAAAILAAAWSLGYPAVAACDFEDELPDQGGRSLRDHCGS